MKINSLSYRDDNQDSLASMVNQLWRAKWLLALIFFASLAFIFAFSQLIPDRVGVRMAFIAPSEAGSRDLLTAPLLDRKGEVAFVVDRTNIYQRFFSAVQSASVKRKLFEEFIERQRAQAEEVSFNKFIRSIEIKFPEYSDRQPQTVASELVIKLWGKKADDALWLAKRFKELAHEHALETLKADFSAAQRAEFSALSQLIEKLRQDYAMESEQELARLEERLVLLRLVHKTRAEASDRQVASELSLMLESKELDSDLPVYLLSETTLSSAIESTSKKLSQIRSRQNPDLFIRHLPNLLNHTKLLEQVELKSENVEFVRGTVEPMVDDSLRSPKRFLLSVIGAVLLTILAMVVVLLTPLIYRNDHNG